MCPRPRCRRPGAEDPGLPRGRPLLARGHLLAALPAIPLLHSPGRPHRRPSPGGVVVEAHQRPPRVAARERLATAVGAAGPCLPGRPARRLPAKSLQEKRARTRPWIILEVMSSTPPEKSSSLPSLTRALAPERLRDIAGAKVYARGQALATGRHVVSWALSGRGLQGRVRGEGRAFQRARITEDARGLDAECSCALFAREGFCEHLVALGLAWLAPLEPTTSPGRPRGLEAVQAYEPPSPTDARLVPLVQALGRLRARVFERTGAEPPGVLRLRLQGEPLVAHVHESSPRTDAHKSHRADVHARCVRVEPLGVLAGEVALVCSLCGRGDDARCAHSLFALDTWLDALGDSRRAEQNAQLAERLFVKPGRELLEALDKVRLPSLARGESQAVSRVRFLLDGVEAGTARLRLQVSRPLPRGGFSRGYPVTARELPEVRALLTSPEETQALQLCLLMHRHPGAAERHPLLVQALKLLGP